jgi:hypothetical protein
MSLVKSPATDKWLVFVVSLPTTSTTLRMRIWRAMKALGCAVLRDSVYLLPAGRGLRQALRVHAEEIKNSGGNAYLLHVASSSSEEKHDFQNLFDHSSEYKALLEKINAFRCAYQTAEVGSARRQIKNLRRELGGITATDYFPKPLRFEVEDRLAQAETTFLASLSPREPDSNGASIVIRQRQDYQARRWASHKQPDADRLASAWLIQRFIDTKATFIWLPEGAKISANVTGFGFEKSEFSPSSNQTTFEVLCTSFDMERDPGLLRIGSIIHCLAANTADVTEAIGVARLLKGVRRTCKDNDALLAETSRLFDLLYAGYTEGGSKM